MDLSRFQGDDQIVLCSKDSQGHVYVRNMFVGGQAPQYIVRDRPSYGLRNTDGYSNATHIVCDFVRTLSPQTDTLVESDGKTRPTVDRKKFVNLKEPHYMYPIYSDQDLVTSQGMQGAEVEWSESERVLLDRFQACAFPSKISSLSIIIRLTSNVASGRNLILALVPSWRKFTVRQSFSILLFHDFLCTAILNIIAWILLASAGVMVARYFDSIWPEYERRAVVDANGVVTGEKLQRRRRFSYSTVGDPLCSESVLNRPFFALDRPADYDHRGHSHLDRILLHSFRTQLEMDVRNSSHVAFDSWCHRPDLCFSRGSAFNSNRKPEWTTKLIDVCLAVDRISPAQPTYKTILLLVLVPMVDYHPGSLSGCSRDFLGNGQPSFRLMDMVLVAFIRLVHLSLHRATDLWNSCVLLRQTRLWAYVDRRMKNAAESFWSSSSSSARFWRCRLLSGEESRSTTSTRTRPGTSMPSGSMRHPLSLSSF